MIRKLANKLAREGLRKSYRRAFCGKGSKKPDLPATYEDQIHAAIERQQKANLEALKDPTGQQWLNPEDLVEQLGKKAEIEMTEEHAHLMINNPLKKEGYLETNRPGGIFTEKDLVFRTKENPLAAEILSKKEFDLADPQLVLKERAESSLFFDKDAGYKSFSIGDVEVMPKDTIFIEDIDPANIPKDLHIQLFKQEKEFIVVGKRVEGATIQFEPEIDGQSPTKSNERIDSEIFVEESYEEIRRTEMNPLENFILMLNPADWLTTLFKLFPLTVFLYYLSKGYAERARVSSEIHSIDRQKVEGLIAATSRAESDNS